MNVLIVDDIPYVVENMQHGIAWENLGVRHVFPAFNVAQAKAVLQERQIDLLLCDIEMPCQDGFDLIKWCKEQGLDFEYIFLTAHADFDYARRALQLGCFDYILQPAALDDITRTVRLALNKLRDKRNQYALSPSSGRADSSRLSLMEGGLKRLIMNDLGAEKIRHELSALGIEVAEFPLFGGMICRAEQADACPSSLDILLALPILPQVDEKALVSALEPGLFACFVPLYEQEEAGQMSALSRWARAARLLAAKEDRVVGGSPEAVFAFLRKRLSWERPQRAEPPSEGHEDTFSAAFRYIKDHLDRELRRTDVANHVFIHPDHLSRLFKKRTGLSLGDFILKEKMNAASALLIKTNIPVSLIASKVGFENDSYFSQAFRRTFSMSPSEYRAKARQETNEE